MRPFHRGHIWQQFRLAVKLKAKTLIAGEPKPSGCCALSWPSSSDHRRKYALNSNFTSRFARKLMDEEPEEFAGFFGTQTLKGGEIQQPFAARPQ